MNENCQDSKHLASMSERSMTGDQMPTKHKGIAVTKNYIELIIRSKVAGQNMNDANLPVRSQIR